LINIIDTCCVSTRDFVKPLVEQNHVADRLGELAARRVERIDYRQIAPNHERIGEVVEHEIDDRALEVDVGGRRRAERAVQVAHERVERELLAGRAVDAIERAREREVAKLIEQRARVQSAGAARCVGRRRRAADERLHQQLAQQLARVAAVEAERLCGEAEQIDDHRDVLAGVRTHADSPQRHGRHVRLAEPRLRVRPRTPEPDLRLAHKVDHERNGGRVDRAVVGSRDARQRQPAWRDAGQRVDANESSFDFGEIQQHAGAQHVGGRVVARIHHRRRRHIEASVAKRRIRARRRNERNATTAARRYDNVVLANLHTRMCPQSEQ
jgi:hypothetical protein